MRNKFRILGWCEGTSLLTLLLVAMPIKYLLHEPLAVRVVGSLHGGLFIAYCLFATILYKQEKWSFEKLFTAYFLSVVPFGTFIFEKKYLHQE